MKLNKRKGDFLHENYWMLSNFLRVFGIFTGIWLSSGFSFMLTFPPEFKGVCWEVGLLLAIFMTVIFEAIHVKESKEEAEIYYDECCSDGD